MSITLNGILTAIAVVGAAIAAVASVIKQRSTPQVAPNDCSSNQCYQNTQPSVYEPSRRSIYSNNRVMQYQTCSYDTIPNYPNTNPLNGYGYGYSYTCSYPYYDIPGNTQYQPRNLYAERNIYGNNVYGYNNQYHQPSYNGYKYQYGYNTNSQPYATMGSNSYTYNNNDYYGNHSYGYNNNFSSGCYSNSNIYQDTTDYGSYTYYPTTNTCYYTPNNQQQNAINNNTYNQYKQSPFRFPDSNSSEIYHNDSSKISMSSFKQHSDDESNGIVNLFAL